MSGYCMIKCAHKTFFCYSFTEFYCLPLQCVPVTTNDSCFNTFHGTINIIIWNYTLLKADAIQLQQNKKQNGI